MEINRRENNNIILLDINGEIDLYNAPEIKDVIAKLIDEKRYQIVINLEKVSYIDSSGIGALISSLSNLKKYQGGLKIINVAGSVRKVFELTKLTSFFEIFDGFLTLTHLSRDIHEQSQLSEVTGLDRHVNHRQLNPSATLVDTCSKKEGINQ